jgi:mono/diheme cytochrome c family protein
MKRWFAGVFALACLCGPQLASAQDGVELYAENCAECHGPEGRADTDAGRDRHVPSFAGRKLTRQQVFDFVLSHEDHRQIVDVIHPNELVAIAVEVVKLSQ